MNTSEQINELATALAKAQGTITGALKDSANPFFRSSYADLASVWDACRKALSENGLAVVQTASASDNCVNVSTMLTHSSGQWIRDTLPLIPKDGSPQAVGSCITYGRRYALAAMVGVAQVDDDGNAASGKIHPGSNLDPRGDAVKNADPTQVSKWAAALVKNAEAADDSRLVDAWNEIKDDHDLAVAVWSKIPKPIRDRIKDARNGQ